MSRGKGSESMTVRTADEFFAKYHQTDDPSITIDGHINKDGLQSQFAIDEVKKDYESLESSAEKYKVFDRLEKAGDSYVLQELIDFDKTQLSYDHHLEGLRNHLTRFQDDASIESLWSRRLKVRETQFAVEQAFQMMVGAYYGFGGVEAPDHLSSLYDHYMERQKLQGEMEKIYDEFPGGDAGNPLWDTDRDGTFDSLDMARMNPLFSGDIDGDGLPDVNDSAFLTSIVWPQNVGDSMTVDLEYNTLPITVTKLGERHFSAELTVKVAANPYDTEAEQAKVAAYLTPAGLTGIEQALAKVFEEKVEGPGVQLDFSLKLTTNLKGPFGFNRSPDVYFTGSSDRSNAKNWAVDLIEDPLGVMHEVGHLLGLADYYFEPLISARVRDYSANPGVGVWNKDHFMGSHHAPGSRIPKGEILAVISQALLKHHEDEGRNAAIAQQIYTGESNADVKASMWFHALPRDTEISTLLEYLDMPYHKETRRWRLGLISNKIALRNDGTHRAFFNEHVYPALNLDNPDDYKEIMRHYQFRGVPKERDELFEEQVAACLARDPISPFWTQSLFFYAVNIGDKKLAARSFDQFLRATVYYTDQHRLATVDQMVKQFFTAAASENNADEIKQAIREMKRPPRYRSREIHKQIKKAAKTWDGNWMR